MFYFAIQVSTQVESATQATVDVTAAVESTVDTVASDAVPLHATNVTINVRAKINLFI